MPPPPSPISADDTNGRTGILLRTMDAAEIAAARRLEIEVKDFWHSPMVPFDSALAKCSINPLGTPAQE